MRLSSSLLPKAKEGAGRLAHAINGVDRAELERARSALGGAREKFVYDWTGKTFDAFSALLVEICTLLASVTKQSQK